jgi:hypothetical protein
LHPHPPYRGFVANKELTAIQPDGHRAVESLFSRFFDLESRSIFSAIPIADFTLWLMDKTLLIAALWRLNLRFQRLGFQRNVFPPPRQQDFRIRTKCNSKLYRFLFALSRCHMVAMRLPKMSLPCRPERRASPGKPG